MQDECFSVSEQRAPARKGLRGSTGARGELLSVRQPNCRELSRRKCERFGLGGHQIASIQSHQPLARLRAGDASDTNPAPARQPTTIQTKGRRHGPARHRRGRGEGRVLVVASPRDHAIEATHHHHKYLPNRPRQSRQEQAPRRPTRPRPRASPTRRRRTLPPRQSPRRPRPPRAPARGAPRPARRWPRAFPPRS